MSQIEPQGKSFVKEYQVERIIVDSDFDGVMCGAMLRIVFPNAQILQSKASEIQEGKIDDLITKKTLMADLRYSPKCGYFFDHHESNKPDHGFIGEWSLVDSAAQVIYSYFGNVADFTNFKELISDINKFDSGNITIEDFNNPSELFQLALVINRHEKFFNLWLIELLAKFTLSEVCDHPFVIQKFERFKNARKEISAFVKKNTIVADGVAFIDTQDFPLKEKMTSYVFTSEFPEAEVVVVVKPHDQEDLKKVRLYRNNFFNNNKEINLLNIAYKISPKTAGGHKGACGLNLPSSYSIEDLQKVVLEEIKKQTDN